MLLALAMILSLAACGGSSAPAAPEYHQPDRPAYVFILATGMLLCILTGGNIDLSVGSVVCFTGAVGALLMATGMNMWLAVAAMLVIGLIIGGLQAFCIAYVHVPPFITTLAGQLIFRGLSNVILNGRTQTVNVQAFKNIFGGSPVMQR